VLAIAFVNGVNSPKAPSVSAMAEANNASDGDQPAWTITRKKATRYKNTFLELCKRVEGADFDEERLSRYKLRVSKVQGLAVLARCFCCCMHRHAL